MGISQVMMALGEIPVPVFGAIIGARATAPNLFLDPELRSGMTPFQRPEYQEAVALGCDLLAKDIETGQINQIMAQHESNTGEGTFITAHT